MANPVWSRHAIASAIVTHLVQGIKGVDTNTYIIPQLKQEIDLERANIIRTLQEKDKKEMRLSDFVQKITCVPTDCQDLHSCCTSHRADRHGEHYGDSHRQGMDNRMVLHDHHHHMPRVPLKKQPTLHFRIPELSTALLQEPLMYVGAVNYSRSIRMYYDPTSALAHTRKFLTGNTPFGWIDMSVDEQNMHNGWLWNIPLIKVLTVHAIFDNPTDVYEHFGCCAPYIDTNPYPAPNWMVDMIIKNLAQKYIQLYQQTRPNQIVVPDNNAYTT